MKHTEKEFQKALEENNLEYARYLEKKLGEIYNSIMKKYAGTPDHNIK